MTFVITKTFDGSHLGKVTDLNTLFTKLFDGEHSVTGRKLAARTEPVVQDARDKVDEIMHRVPTKISDEVDSAWDEQANGFVVGIRPIGDISIYLADKEQRENTLVGTWLRPALRRKFRT